MATSPETCVLCHGAGQLADAMTMHQAAAVNPLVRNFATINSVTIPTTAPIKPVVNFTVRDAPTGGNVVTGLSSFNFTVAQLLNQQLVDLTTGGAPTTGGLTNWRSIINRNYATPPDVSIGGSTEVSQNARSSTTNAKQLSGTLVEGPPGTYTYTFGNDLSAVAATPDKVPTYGVVTYAFDPSLPTRIGVMSSANLPGSTATTAPNGTVINPTPPFNATFDLSTYDTTVSASDPDPRGLVNTAACNACHQRLGAHGNRRLDVNFCVTCHNAFSQDPATPPTNRPLVDFKRVIHKLHMGKNLPSVKAGGTFTFNGQDFSDVTFPRMTSNSTSDPGDCTACHGASTTCDPKLGPCPPRPSGPAADHWKTTPSMEACGACHDLTSFAATAPAGFTLHSGGPQPDNNLCASCHASGSGIAPVDVTHTGLPDNQLALRSKFKYTIVSVANTAPGQAPVVTYKVTDNNDVPYTLTEPAWTSGAASRLFIDIVWSVKAPTTAANTNYTNQGSGTNPGQPVQIDAIAKKTAGANPGEFTVTSPVAIPANAVGVGQVVMEGHPADTSVKPAGRISVQNVTKTFAITGTATTARRKVVDVNKCDVCHGFLSLHGNNRTNAIEVCVSCHNANATDINQRPTTGTTADGLAEQSIDFKRLIHGIHGAEFSGNGPIIYGFGKSVNDFSKAVFPGVLQNCESCHLPGTYSASFPEVNGTTTSTQTLADPSTYLRTTRITATCSACHTKSIDAAHMKQNGAGFGMTQAQIDALQ